MQDSPQNNNSINIFQLSAHQRHDLSAALLSVKWAAELLKPSDGSEPPVDLICNQLVDAYQRLKPVIDQLLSSTSQQSASTYGLKGTSIS